MKKLLGNAIILALAIHGVHTVSASENESTATERCSIVGDAERALVPDDPDEDAREIMALERQMCIDFQRGDMDLMITFTHPDAIILPPGAEMVVGKRAIADAYAAMSATTGADEGFELAWDPIHAVVHGDLGWAYGLIRSKMPGEAERLGKYVTVWVRMDGDWYYVAEIRNDND